MSGVTKKEKSTSNKTSKRQYRFDESLALFQYMLSLFGCNSLDALCEGMKDETWEGWDEQNISRYYFFLTTRLFEYPGIT